MSNKRIDRFVTNPNYRLMSCLDPTKMVEVPVNLVF